MNSKSINTNAQKIWTEKDISNSIFSIIKASLKVLRIFRCTALSNTIYAPSEIWAEEDINNSIFSIIKASPKVLRILKRCTALSNAIYASSKGSMILLLRHVYTLLTELKA